ncbi:MAG: PIN domain-containing protein [Solirubrobacteraceae bacterium MAG38_C4-C5]|nr:PIN domain-containing protein [Candidatus Siliceabacter maunaloa]
MRRPHPVALARGAIVAGATQFGVSSELLQAHDANVRPRGRVDLDPDVNSRIADPSAAALPVDPDVALAAARLPRDDFPGDPADRMIYASARVHGVPLVTRDGALRAFDPRGTLW